MPVNPEMRPNVLIILMDELRKDVACHEKYPFVETPHIDRFRQSAVTFDNAFCQYPVCVPSRASLITGRYPHQIGMVNNRCNLLPETATIAEAFASAGYAVPAFGKTHRQHKGFSKYPERKSLEGYGTSDYGMAAPSDKIVGVFEGPMEEQHDLAAVAQFREFLGRRDVAQPFLAFLGIMAPHPPLYPPVAFSGRYPVEDVVLPQVDSKAWRRKPLCQRESSLKIWLSRDEKTRRAIIAAYLDMVTYADHVFGEALSALDSAGLARETIVVLMSDHGEMLGEHNMLGKMNSLYEDVLRFPLFVRIPGEGARGVRRAQLVEMIDLAPTFFALTGVPVIHGLPGRSLVEAIRDANHVHRHEVFSMTQKARMVRDSRWKLSVYADGDGELYDLECDPQEASNLYGDSAFEEERHRLEARLLRHWVEHGPCPVNESADDH